MVTLVGHRVGGGGNDQFIRNIELFEKIFNVVKTAWIALLRTTGELSELLRTLFHYEPQLNKKPDQDKKAIEVPYTNVRKNTPYVNPWHRRCYFCSQGFYLFAEILVQSFDTLTTN